MPVEAEVLIPQPGYKHLSQSTGFKVIILLHGANNDRSEWLLKSQIHDMVRELPVIVFMPSGKNSFYINTWNGYRYMDFVSCEIPSFIRNHFRVSDKKEDWLIAGESMGGYGALVNGFLHPDTFGNIAQFSGALNIHEIRDALPGIRMENLFGPNLEKAATYDPYALADKVPNEKRPRLFMCCGNEDMLYAANRRFFGVVRNGYDVRASWGIGGHEFQYWNEKLKEMLVWFMEEEVSEGFMMGRNGNDFH